MTQTFLRGLALLELLDRAAPLTVTEISAALTVDKATGSRLVTAAEADGWVIRRNRRVELGPRAALLGQGSIFTEVVRRVEHLVHAVAGVTGFITQAIALVGTHTVALAGAAGRTPIPADVPAGLHTRLPLWAGAGSKVIAAQLPPHTLNALLPPDPLPNPRLAMQDYAPVVRTYFTAPRPSQEWGRTAATTRRELDEQLEAIRRDRIFHEVGELLPNVSCIAVPWIIPELPASLACIGPADELGHQARNVTTVLRAAAAPGAAPTDVLGKGHRPDTEPR